MNNTFVAFTAIGPRYINQLIENFQKFPSNIEVLVMTNTPEVFDIPTHFKLHVADIEMYRSDKNREQEPLVRVIGDQDLYKQHLKQLFAKGKAFPLAVSRYAMKWMLDRNISKFFICDTGCKFWKYETIIPRLEKITSHRNTIIIHPQGAFERPLNLLDYINGLDAYDILLAHGIDFSCLDKKISWKDISVENSPIIELNYWQTSEAWMMGFWFNDISYLRKYYDLWTVMHEHALEKGLIWPCSEQHFIGLEAVADPLNAVFCKQFDVLLAPSSDIFEHGYTSHWFLEWRNW